ncbi:mechanosensitive ion channel family protein [candidate division WOR-3 bacterium]|uniref:Mechanosensitive ion channel family protein n=1 Tax=candidate division WOR-3 bacterium TaxID=2052148 RepID=A0A660SDB8_UNCW3|nr:MAG: mechanosensitive ion channel family protein [candidate division WOR-3 bacterium]
MITPIILILAGGICGFVIEKIFLSRLRAFALKTKWRGDEVIIESLQHVIIFWGVVGGIYGAIHTVGMAPSFRQLLQKALIIILIVSATIIAARMIVGFINLRRDILPATSIFKNFIKIIVFTLGFLIVLQTLGISITPLITALGVGGLAVALALQDTLSNLFAGIHIIISKQLRPGDYIRLDTGEEGYVMDVSWRNTKIRAIPNNIVVIPNAKLASSIITNYHMPVKELSVRVQVGVSYDSDLEKVERVTVEVAREVMKEVPGGVPDFEPFIRYHTFGDFSINFTVIMRVKEFTDKYLITHEFIKRLHKRYKKEGIEIPFPIRTIYMEKG